MLLRAQAQLVLFDYWWLFTEQCSGEQGEEGPPGVAAAGLAQHPLGPRRRAALWWLWWWEVCGEVWSEGCVVG